MESKGQTIAKRRRREEEEEEEAEEVLVYVLCHSQTAVEGWSLSSKEAEEAEERERMHVDVPSCWL